MHVEPASGYKPPAVPDTAKGLGKADTLAPDAARVADSTSPSVQAEAAVYVRLAAKVPEIDQDAVAEARRLLESGELATPESIRRAAERILRDGI